MKKVLLEELSFSNGEKMIDEMAAAWGLVMLREDLPAATCGLINKKTIRNDDSRGLGIEGKFAINSRKIAYPTCCVIKYLKEKIRKHNPAQPKKNGGSHE